MDLKQLYWPHYLLIKRSLHMRIEAFIDRRCTVDVRHTSRNYRFTYKGHNHKYSTLERVHDFFLNRCPELDTVYLRLQEESYYLRATLDEPEKYKTLRHLRAELSQQSSGAWIEQEGGERHYFIDKGWLFSRPERSRKKNSTRIALLDCCKK